MRMLGALPSTSQSISLSDALDKFTQSNFRYVQGILRALASGHQPKFGAECASSDFLVSVKDRIGCFVRFSVPAAEDQPAKEVVGKEALKALFAQAKAEVDGGTDMTLQKLKTFDLYQWMMDPVFFGWA